MGKNSLKKQVYKTLSDKYQKGRGESRAAHKAAGDASAYIFSKSTFEDYLKSCNRFVIWCAENGCKSLQDCQKQVEAYMSTRSNLSPYTQASELSALSKLFSCKNSDFDVSLPKRERTEIQRSRHYTEKQEHFSEARNASLVEFCRSTGLRRSELEKVRGTDLHEDSKGVYITVKGKGGKVREAHIYGNVALVKELSANAGSSHIFSKISSACPVHQYRAEYASRIYRAESRDIKSLDRQELYICRADMAGERFDKTALQKVSSNLGHNRLSVAVSHYSHMF